MTYEQICCKRHFRCIPRDLKRRYNQAKRNSLEAAGAVRNEIADTLAQGVFGPHDIVVCGVPGCNERVIFLPNRFGSFTPVNASRVHEEDTAVNVRKHILHSKTCRDPGYFSKGRY